MTRKEEIRQAAANYIRMFPLNNINKFTYIDGAEWADKTMIERACKWLEDNADVYIWYDEIEHECGMKDDFIKDFRKAMEK